MFEQVHRESPAQREYWEKWAHKRKEQIIREYDYHKIQKYQRTKKETLERYELDDDTLRDENIETSRFYCQGVYFRL